MIDGNCAKLRPRKLVFIKTFSFTVKFIHCGFFALSLFSFYFDYWLVGYRKWIYPPPFPVTPIKICKYTKKCYHCHWWKIINSLCNSFQYEYLTSLLYNKFRWSAPHPNSTIKSLKRGNFKRNNLYINIEIEGSWPFFISVRLVSTYIYVFLVCVLLEFNRRFSFFFYKFK